MPSVKIKDLREGPPIRRLDIYRIGQMMGVKIEKSKGKRVIYYAIVAYNQLEKLLDDKTKQAFAEEGFEVQDPPETNALGSFFVKDLDDQINN